ncbi:MBL fold metallo-hydrolase [Sphaerotilus microaerophilus]|uniref:Zn-dependent hydrolase n=1 Tax=Sphaerotilus microaerophilus TaxID=2914710 RepID=A0ABN6PEN8_9BURK|nr:MBL fold metallo-hydrolase [Sphaerotilus sp. FB-5]BDI03413.1 Zn-dependent hydrolase [Sphaerotilus sp. FB-5]
MANAQEHELHYPLGDVLPETGTTLEVAPGVRWLSMKLPFALDHINLWLLRDELDGRAGWTIVDCGITTESTREAWEQVFASAELEGLPVLRVIVTHMHPDHLGLAHWLCERWSTPEQPCRLWISATDWNAGRMASQTTTGFGGDAAAAFFCGHGLVDPEAVARVRSRSNYYATMVPQVPAQFRRLMDGQALRIGVHEWRCWAGHGHSPEHISLHCEALGLLISGDMVLPRISTNISVIDLEPEGNPLPLYLASLERLRALPAGTFVLPSHGKPFTGLHARIDQLVAHHDERLAEVVALCAQAPASAADVLPVMFKRVLDLHQTTFAMGEAVAHLNALWLGGQLRRERGADGIWRFAPAA